MRKTIRRNELLPKGSHIAVGLSGDNDSILLLYLLCRLNEKRCDLKISAILADEGIRGYRKKMVPAIEKYCKQQGIALHLTSYQTLFKMTLDEIAGKLKGKNIDICTCCRVLRTIALNREAEVIGTDCLAVGCNMDDEVQAITAGYFSCDIMPEMKSLFKFVKEQPPYLRIIKPLAEVPEKEAALYARLKGFYAEPKKCPYWNTSFGRRIGDMLDNLEAKHSGVKFNILRTHEKIEQLL
ncbi:MAG: hypothetical protein IMF01_10415 [Proteobacteria bacterium]|nr:hypothetical protein [Pseudomonadota bacterium]